MKKVLFLPAGIGLAHTGRLIMIARELRKSGIEVIFGAGSDAVLLLKRESLPYVKILEFSREIYEKKIKKNNWFIYNRHNFIEFVKDELRLYKKIKPNLVVYDARITVKVSSHIARIPTVSVTNANATDFYDYEKTEFPVQTTFGRFLPAKIVSILEREYGQRFLKKIGKRAIPAMVIAAIIKIGPALIKLGYLPNKDPFQGFMGDLTLIADIPQFRPIKRLSAQVKLVGPIFWDGGGALPAWQDKIKDKDNLIYVSASGTGDKETFLKILKYLKDTNYTVVATTGNTLLPSEVKINYPSLFITDYLPGIFIMPKAKLIIFPGGNATCYQALTYGVPQIITPFHIDQEDNANQLERLGTGKIVSPYSNFKRRNLLKTISKILSKSSYQSNALKLKNTLQKYNGKKTAALYIEKFISRKI